MDKKGFTLIELLAVIILLAIVAIIATPIVMNMIEDSKDSANKRSIEGYARAVKQAYYNEQALGQTPVIDEEFLSNIDTSGGQVICHNVIYHEDYGVVLNICETEEKLDKEYCYLGEKHYDCNDKEYISKYAKFGPPYTDLSGANSPKLYDNMIPIMYDGTNWVYANVTQKWYDYDNQEWANAVVLNSGVTKNIGDIVSESEIALWYVWIPRYTYTIFNGNNESVEEQIIDIKFERDINSSGTVKCIDNINSNDNISEKCTDSINGGIVNGTSTYTHPAFTFGDEELTGFWVGKFEVSGTSDLITIKPGVSSLRNQTISSFFNAIKGIQEDYNLNGDSHMIKNMEWGAVAYLKQSKYGMGEIDIAINNNGDTYYAGGGIDKAYKTNVNQSTTGNIYGVYDMSGNAWEYVMGNMANSSGLFYSGLSGFTNELDTKYYDKYTYSISHITHGRGKLGDATKEILARYGQENGGWYDDYSYFINEGNPWFARGGYYELGLVAGTFYFTRSSGDVYVGTSSRAILS